MKYTFMCLLKTVCEMIADPTVKRKDFLVTHKGIRYSVVVYRFRTAKFAARADIRINPKPKG